MIAQSCHVRIVVEQELHGNTTTIQRTVHHAMRTQGNPDVGDPPILAIRKKQQVTRCVIGRGIDGNQTPEQCLLPGIAWHVTQW